MEEFVAIGMVVGKAVGMVVGKAVGTALGLEERLFFFLSLSLGFTPKRTGMASVRHVTTLLLAMRYAEA